MQTLSKILALAELLPPVKALKRQCDAAVAERDAAIAERDAALTQRDSRPAGPLDRYNNWASGVFRNNVPAPAAWLACSWGPGDPLHALASNSLLKAEYIFARRLLNEIEANGVSGAVVEFGVFEGDWLAILIEACAESGINREFFGFDSFEGLPKPLGDKDLSCWSEGQYAADFEAVQARLQCDKRPFVKLIKGWFSETLHSEVAQNVAQIAYARIDCDLYEPTLTCLAYLSDRLSDGAILVFDDWTWDLEKSETRAFYEWNLKQDVLDFELLAHNGNGHLYLKAYRKGRPDEIWRRQPLV